MKITTINNDEINKFNKIADEWWNPEGKFKPLHKFNPTRIKYIKKNLFQRKIIIIEKIINKHSVKHKIN